MTFVLPSSCVERHWGEFGHDDGRPAVAWFHLLDGDRMVDGVLEEATMAYPVPEGTTHASRYLAYPPDRVGEQPALTRLELLRELEFCDGYLPDASYVTLLSIEGRDNQRHDVDWAVSSVAELREHITSGRFRQHWYVSNRGGFYGPARSSPESEGSSGDYGRGPDYYSLMAECDSCGETFDPSVQGTLDWQGCGLENCGCGSECSLGPVPPGLAYDADGEAIRFVRYSPAQRAASLAVPSGAARRRRQDHTRPSSRERHVDANASLLARARSLVPVSSSLTGSSGRAKALVVHPPRAPLEATARLWGPSAPLLPSSPVAFVTRSPRRSPPPQGWLTSARRRSRTTWRLGWRLASLPSRRTRLVWLCARLAGTSFEA